LQEALEANEPLANAYYLKEELRQIWKQPNKAAAASISNSGYAAPLFQMLARW